MEISKWRLVARYDEQTTRGTEVASGQVVRFHGRLWQRREMERCMMVDGLGREFDVMHQNYCPPPCLKSKS